eukprot:scaffold82522_cov57-Phaeocystis_antarctica.AAC.6
MRCFSKHHHYRCTHTHSGNASSTVRSAAARGASSSQHTLSMWRRPSRTVPGGRVAPERCIMRQSSTGPTCGEAAPGGCASGKACTRRSTRLRTPYCTSLRMSTRSHRSACRVHTASTERHPSPPGCGCGCGWKAESSLSTHANEGRGAPLRPQASAAACCAAGAACASARRAAAPTRRWRGCRGRGARGGGRRPPPPRCWPQCGCRRGAAAASAVSDPSRVRAPRPAPPPTQVPCDPARTSAPRLPGAASAARGRARACWRRRLRRSSGRACAGRAGAAVACAAPRASLLRAVGSPSRAPRGVGTPSPARDRSAQAHPRCPAQGRRRARRAERCAHTAGPQCTRASKGPLAPPRAARAGGHRAAASG